MVVSLFVTPPVNGQQPFIDFSVIELVPVLVLFMIVETIAVISGAHVNPAVTLAMMVIRQIKVVDGVTFGGICAEAIGTFFLVWAIVGVAVSPLTQKGVASCPASGVSKGCSRSGRCQLPA
jgi:glycerol uptake facilitator-like aquaporin